MWASNHEHEPNGIEEKGYLKYPKPELRAENSMAFRKLFGSKSAEGNAGCLTSSWTQKTFISSWKREAWSKPLKRDRNYCGEGGKFHGLEFLLLALYHTAIWTSGDEDSGNLQCCLYVLYRIVRCRYSFVVWRVRSPRHFGGARWSVFPILSLASEMAAELGTLLMVAAVGPHQLWVKYSL